MASFRVTSMVSRDNERRPAILRRRLWLLGLPAIVAAVVALGLVLAGVGPTLFGYNSYVMWGGSMGPTVPSGSILVSRPVRAEALAVSDVITFRRPGHPNTNITHRIVAINYKNGQRVFLTKGDTNKDIDPEVALLQGEVDRMTYAVPFAGYLITFARSREGIMALLLLPALLLLALEVASLRRRSTTTLSAANNADAASSAEVRAALEEMRRFREAIGEFRARLGK